MSYSRFFPRVVGQTVLLSSLIWAGCQTGSLPRLPTETRDGAPAHAPANLAHLPDPLPSFEPPSKRGNPATYEVFGKRYSVWPSAVGYVADGNASWYGTKFHGRDTSSGEPFDMYKLTAAHKSLPIPTYARVTNLANNKTTIVRINDRGPFHDDRLLDLSYAAAVKLGFHNKGTARVRIETITQPKTFYLQSRAYGSLSEADVAKADFQKHSAAPVGVMKLPGENGYRVRVGPIIGEKIVQQIKSRVDPVVHPGLQVLPAG